MTGPGQRIVITGGSGFIGTNAVEHFLKAGYEVLNLDCEPPRNPSHGDIWQKSDVTEPNSLRRFISDFGPDSILHLAARTDLDGRTIADYRVNEAGVRNILAIAAEQPGIRRVIFASSRMVCPIGYVPTHDEDYRPPNPYGMSKVLGEKVVRDSATRVEWIIVRPTSIWGPWFGVPYRTFFDMIGKGLYFHPGRHDPPKSFGYVENTVFQLHQLLDAPSQQVDRRTFYLCDYVPLRPRSWAEMVRTEMGRPPIPTISMPILRCAALVGDLAKRLGWSNPPLTSFRLRNLVTDMAFDTGELEAVCGPLPVPVKTGVERTVAWLSGAGRSRPGPRPGFETLPPQSQVGEET